jgi:hypothetical protein
VKPEQWQYSNYAEFVEKRKGSLVDRDFVKINFGTPATYKDFVMNYIPPEKRNCGITYFGTELCLCPECVALSLLKTRMSQRHPSF